MDKEIIINAKTLERVYFNGIVKTYALKDVSIQIKKGKSY